MYTQYKLLDLVEGKEEMPEAAELKGSVDEASVRRAWRKLLDVHSPTHATGIVLLARRLRDIKFVDGELMQPVLDEMHDIFTKLQGSAPEERGLHSRARIHEEDLRQRSVERSEEGAGYGVGGGKSGFKKKWKGKNKDNPKEDGGGVKERCASTARSTDIIGGSATNDPRIGPRLHQATSMVARGVGESWELVERRMMRTKVANLRSRKPGSSSS
ncbi:unnamed protein product [Closterium sp. NIES-65]|nr:unnamed protein product [Closterium sp. NIES-65]